MVVAQLEVRQLAALVRGALVVLQREPVSRKGIGYVLECRVHGSELLRLPICVVEPSDVRLRLHHAALRQLLVREQRASNVSLLEIGKGNLEVKPPRALGAELVVELHRLPAVRRRTDAVVQHARGVQLPLRVVVQRRVAEVPERRLVVARHPLAIVVQQSELNCCVVVLQTHCVLQVLDGHGVVPSKGGRLARLVQLPKEAVAMRAAAIASLAVEVGCSLDVDVHAVTEFVELAEEGSGLGVSLLVCHLEVSPRGGIVLLFVIESEQVHAAKVSLRGSIAVLCSEVDVVQELHVVGCRVLASPAVLRQLHQVRRLRDVVAPLLHLADHVLRHRPEVLRSLRAERHHAVALHVLVGQHVLRLHVLPARRKRVVQQRQRNVWLGTLAGLEHECEGPLCLWKAKGSGGIVVLECDLKVDVDSKAMLEHSPELGHGLGMASTGSLLVEGLCSGKVLVTSSGLGLEEHRLRHFTALALSQSLFCPRLCPTIHILRMQQLIHLLPVQLVLGVLLALLRRCRRNLRLLLLLLLLLPLLELPLLLCLQLSSLLCAQGGLGLGGSLPPLLLHIRLLPPLLRPPLLFLERWLALVRLRLLPQLPGRLQRLGTLEVLVVLRHYCRRNTHYQQQQQSH
mmetsp:Transcript_12376/g.49607  ORF Transcript_12376/g.49607 Transcript_12376/m.49607 type:complete len:627 (-) Transcript_12376:33-1913(-)